MNLYKLGPEKFIINFFAGVLLILCFTLILLMIGELTVSAEKFTIMHTNDEHSQLIPHTSVLDYHPDRDDSSRGGICRLASLTEDLREERENWAERVFLVSGGDFIGGSPFSWLALAGKAPELELMQKLNYDFITLGNHEFDFGPGGLAEYLEAAGYPAAHDKTAILSSNLILPDGHELEDMKIKRGAVREVSDDLNVGVFGLLGEHAELVNPRTSPAEFACRSDTAREMRDKLGDLGAEIIVAVTHSGLIEDIDLARNVEGIDIIVGGHSHSVLDVPVEVNDTYIVQAGEHLEYLGVLDFRYDRKEGELILKNDKMDQPFLVEIDDNIECCEDMAARVNKITEQLQDYTGEITGGAYEDLFASPFTMEFSFSGDDRFTDSPYGNFFTDAMRLGAEDFLGKRVDFAFQSNGLIRGGLIPGSMPWSDGKISYYELAAGSSLFSGDDGRPGYPLVKAYLTEGEIIRVLEVSSFLSEYMGVRQFFQVSGLRYRYDRRRTAFFTLPGVDIPIPTSRSVLSAERYLGEGIQTEHPWSYEDLERGGDNLYRVVTDYYILEYLPLINRFLPFMSVRPRDSQGEPLDDMRDAIVYKEDSGEELKVWEVVLHYAGMQESRLAMNYSSDQGRITQEHVFSPLAFTWLIPVLLLIIPVIYIVYRLGLPALTGILFKKLKNNQ